MEEPRRKPRSQLLFRYSSILDVLLMLLGSTFGTVAGLALPLVIVVFGFTMDSFTGYEILAILEANNDSNLSYFCSDSLDTIISSEYLEANDPAARNNLLSNAVHSATYYAVGIAVAIFASSFLSRILWAITGSRQALKIRLSFYESVLTRQVGWYDTHSITEMPPYLSNSVPLIEKAIGTHMSSLVQDGVTFLSCFIIALIINWELTLVTSVLIPVIFTVAIVLSKVIEKVSAKQADDLSVAGGVADEVLSAIKTVVAFGGQDKEIQRYHSHLKTLKKHSWMILILTSLTLSFLAMMILQYFALGFWYSSLLFVECSVKPGEILVVVMQVMLGTFTLAELLPELKDFLQAKGSSKAVFEIIDQGSDIDALSDEGLEIDNFRGNIEFKDVTFTYPSRSDVRVLQGVDLKINSGQTVALVGPSGCGKSTVMKLIPRLYEYNTGNVLIDDQEIRSLKVHFLRNQIGIVSQEPILFNVSVRENIAYGVKMDNGVAPREVSMEEIERAAELANAHRFISELPYKYETLVGEGGSQLSGGQKQRIAIARALVRNPKILLLDEATSALDTESEQIVQEALDRAREGRTTIIIAHRLSTIQNADVIVAMDGGRVVEMGTHRELMEKHGLYYNLVMEQSTEETDDDQEHRDFTEAMLQTSLQRMSSVNNSAQPALDGSLRRTTIGRTLTMGLNRAMTNRARANTAPSYRLTSLTSHIEERQPSVYAGYEDKTLWTYLVTLKDILVLTLKPLHWILLTLALLAFVAAGALFTYNFVVLKVLIDKFQILDKNDLLDGVVNQTIQFAIIGGAIFILYITGITMFGLVGEQVVEGVREKSFRSMVKHDMAWYDEPDNSVSILTYNLSVQAKDIFQLFDIRMGSSLRSFVTTIGVVIFSLSASWVIGLVVLPAYVFMFIGAFLQAVLAKKFADKSCRRIEEIAQVTTEYIENMPTVAMLSIEERLVNKYKDLLAEPANDSLKSAAINGGLLGASKAIVYFCIGICFTVGESIYTTDSSNAYYATLPEIFTVIVVLLLTSRMFKTAFNALPDIHKAFLSADDVMVLVRDRVPERFGRVVEDFKGKIRFHDVKFSYQENGSNILRGLTISVDPGKTLALVGPSGSGKSTTISLLEKFYRINSGAILLDDENDIKNLKPSWLREQIALVSQEPILFDMSIADNIRYGANFREVSDDEVEEAARSANIHEFIESLPKGYNTVAGLGGAQLSGGQKQRIAIARALVRNPKILLLDEATSALDVESERIVQEALDRAREGRTTIIIAHRLSTIQNADCIAVLHKGEVIEQGTHAELMGKRGAYFKMHNNHRLYN